jgi:chemotaxis protein histidine kinase CheA
VIFEDDLQRLFAGEVEERSARLLAGAEGLASGGLGEEELRTMVREGHTVKGTARMMGFTAISDAGKALEEAWRAIAAGEAGVDVEVASALSMLAGQLLPAVRADPASGTPGLANGIRALRRALRTEEEPSPPVPEARPSRSQGDLGGLLGAIDSWAFGETVRVNAAGLFRLINEICSLRVDSEALAAAVDRLARAKLDPTAVTEELEALAALVGSADKALLDLQARAVDLAAAPLSEITASFPQLVRYVSRRAGKEVRFEMLGVEHAIDRQVLERLSDPLRHLVVNAVQHGIESPEERQASGKPRTASLVLSAGVRDQRLEIVVEDDGRGVDWAAVRHTALRRGLVSASAAADPDVLRALLFSPRFSTAEPSALIGEGHGLAMVADAVEGLHGTVVLDTRAGQGTRITVTVPTSRALQDAVLVTAAGQTWGIPAIAVLDRLPLAAAAVRSVGERLEMQWEDGPIPVMSLAETVGLRDSAQPDRVVVVSTSFGPTGFLVDQELGRRQVAARELGPILEGVPHLTGAAMLGGGDIVVLVDPSRLANAAREGRGTGPRRRVLVIDDSRGARQVVGGALGSAGFEVDLAASPTEALSVLAEQTFDAIVMDYVLPTMDGATLAAKVRQLGIRVPIVMLSGAATAEDQRRALAAGANAYLDKADLRQGALAAAITDLIAAA